MPFSKETAFAAKTAFALRIPFVTYRLPHSDKVEFFADFCSDLPLRSTRKFAVNSWGNPVINEYVISDRADAPAVLDLYSDVTTPEYTSVKVWLLSTDRSQYESSIFDVIDYLRDHGGKVVISRTIATSNVSVDWVSVAERYFDAHPEAFCYLYFTPRHGFWIGASPEVLLKVNSGTFETMALAGTRPVAEAGSSWSGKNIAEQAIVRNYIVDQLYDIGLAPKCSPTETVTTGPIQHLCTHITGNVEGCTATEILTALNPTPALAGYPMASALEQIVEREAHPRRCYGGYVSLSTDNSYTAYVNLRCVNFDADSWCMYVGGGIMPDSDVDDEWTETEAKASLLRNIILASTNE